MAGAILLFYSRRKAMNNEFGLKELYSVVLKATYPIEIGGRIFEPGEVIARFDKI
jgi:hypothetical protein